jgi:DNA invertase Pin-like site-specific DNA recombinase
MVAEVCLGKVDAVAAREVSHFARNSRDWPQLIELCRVIDTLLVDEEAVYAPRQGNDRLLHGLKGNLNEYERLLAITSNRQSPANNADTHHEAGGPSLRAQRRPADT